MRRRFLVSLAVIAALGMLAAGQSAKAHDPALSGIENLRRSGKAVKRDLRPWFAFGFGLIHGFGFAGALAEVGLPKEALGVALASFNIGVEIGQVTIVLAAAPALALLAAKRPVINKRLVLAGSAFIGVCGAFWFVSRVLGA